MKASSQALKDALRDENGVNIKPILHAQFNYNRFATPTIEHFPPEDTNGYDPEKFPLESLVEPLRPAGGLAKGFVGLAQVVSDSSVDPNRVVVSHEDDKYKHWISQTESDDEGNIDINIVVTYDRVVRVNHIIATFLGFGNTPTELEIETRDASGVWSSAGTMTDDAWTLDDRGRLNIYFYGDWFQDYAVGQFVEIDAIRLKITKTSRPNERLSIIEFGARLNDDLSPYFIGGGSVADSGNPDSLMPIGSASSNIADIEIFNAPLEPLSQGLLFNYDNENSPYYKMLDANVKMTLWYEYTLPDDTKERIKQYTVYTDDRWSSTTDDSFQIRCTDAAKFLQETKPPQKLFENMSTLYIARVLLDSVGFNDYNIDFLNEKGVATIPYFWTNGDDSVWEVLGELFEATQAAMFFDADGILQVKGRDSLYNSEPVWTLRGESSGDGLADIESLEPESEHRPNVIKVKYRKVDIEMNNYGSQLRSTAWEPNEQIIIGASDLSADMTPESDNIVLRASDVATWPFAGMLQIEGEYMSYDAKQYGYWDIDENKKIWIWLESVDDYVLALNRTMRDKVDNSGFSGKLRIKERGLFNTEPRHHITDSSVNYTPMLVRHGTGASTSYKSANFVQKRYKMGEVTVTNGIISSPDKGKMVIDARNIARGDCILLRHGVEGDIPSTHYGTRIKFPKGMSPEPRAGLHFVGGGTRDSGYYLEIRPTQYKLGTAREVRLFIRRPDGTYNFITGDGRGAAIVEDQWYNIDVSIGYETGGHRVAVFLDGVAQGSWWVPAAQAPEYLGRVGMFARGRTYVEFDYLYAVSGGALDPVDDDLTFFDLYSGGFVTDQFQKSFVTSYYKYDRFKKRPAPSSQGYRQLHFYDEFGPVAHEVMEFDVDFGDNVPYLQPTMVNTNDAGISIMNFDGDPFGAKFLAINTSKVDEVFSGQIGNIDQKSVILGYKIRLGDEKEVEVVDEEAVRRFGRFEASTSHSTWVQSEDTANAMAEWIGKHWLQADHTLSVDAFGHNLFEVGDIVAIDYPLQNMTPETHKYFIMEVNDSWREGLSTKLKLRRV